MKEQVEARPKRVELLLRFVESVGHTPAGGHLGIFWVGMCHLGLQIGTPF